MALISPNGNYLRVEDIRIGKDLLQFFAREYSDMAKPPVSDNTYIIKYDINGTNPYVQAYEYLLSKTPGYVSDNIAMVEPTIQDDTVIVDQPAVQEQPKKLRTRKAK